MFCYSSSKISDRNPITSGERHLKKVTKARKVSHLLNAQRCKTEERLGFMLEWERGEMKKIPEFLGLLCSIYVIQTCQLFNSDTEHSMRELKLGELLVI